MLERADAVQCTCSVVDKIMISFERIIDKFSGAMSMNTESTHCMAKLSLFVLQISLLIVVIFSTPFYFANKSLLFQE